MSSFFQLFALLSVQLLLQSSDATSICLWNITTSTGQFTGGSERTYNSNYMAREYNGYYGMVPGQQFNGHDLWKLDRTNHDCQETYYYLYWSNDDRWVIGPNLNIVHGECSEYATHPSLCASWSIGGVPSSAFVTEGNCPSVDCAHIRVNTSKIGSPWSGCKGEAEQQSYTGPNYYTTTTINTGYRWFFNVPTFSWICTACGSSCSPMIDAVTSCHYTSTNSYEYKAESGWRSLADGELYEFQADGASTGGSYVNYPPYTVEMECFGVGLNYTMSPTTPYPTFTPSPTQEPTASPTSPTQEPTYPILTGPGLVSGSESALKNMLQLNAILLFAMTSAYFSI